MASKRNISPEPIVLRAGIVELGRPRHRYQELVSPNADNPQSLKNRFQIFIPRFFGKVTRPSYSLLRRQLEINKLQLRSPGRSSNNKIIAMVDPLEHWVELFFRAQGGSSEAIQALAVAAIRNWLNEPRKLLP